MRHENVSSLDLHEIVMLRAVSYRQKKWMELYRFFWYDGICISLLGKRQYKDVTGMIIQMCDLPEFTLCRLSGMQILG